MGIREKIAQRITDSRCEVCNNCGTSISTDNPDEVADHILADIKEAGFFQEEAELWAKQTEEAQLAQDRP